MQSYDMNWKLALNFWTKRKIIVYKIGFVHLKNIRMHCTCYAFPFYFFFHFQMIVHDFPHFDAHKFHYSSVFQTLDVEFRLKIEITFKRTVWLKTNDFNRLIAIGTWLILRFHPLMFAIQFEICETPSASSHQSYRIVHFRNSSNPICCSFPLFLFSHFILPHTLLA